MKDKNGNTKPAASHPWKKKVDVPPKKQPWEVRTLPHYRPIKT